MQKRTFRILGVLSTGACIGLAAAAWPRLSDFWRNYQRGNADEETVVVDATRATPYIELLPKVVELNGIRTATVTAPTRKRKLELRGQINFDPDSLAHVHGRFPGQIIDLGKIDDPNAEISTQSIKTKRDIRVMDRVVKGQELGVLWSKELGEKKSELVAGLIRLRTDKQNLQQYRIMDKEGATPPRSLREAGRLVEQDQTDVEKAKMTLRSWLIKEEVIEKVEAEADRLHKEQGGRNMQLENEWARVTIEAPRDGTIVEKNVVVGDIVDTNADLFKIADLSRLRVIAHVYEEDLAYLEQIPKPIPWLITISSMPDMPPIADFIDGLGEVMDPNEHMALAFGKIDNVRGDLRAGQFIKASVEIPDEPDIVEIPTRALIEDGVESIVLVQIDPQKYRYAARRVAVVRRYFDVVYVRSVLSAEEKAQGLQELHEGESVVAAGALELKAALMQGQGEPTSDEGDKP